VLSSYLGSKPSYGHSIASDRVTNASGGGQGEAADGPRVVVAALAGSHSA